MFAKTMEQWIPSCENPLSVKTAEFSITQNVTKSLSEREYGAGGDVRLQMATYSYRTSITALRFANELRNYPEISASVRSAAESYTLYI